MLPARPVITRAAANIYHVGQFLSLTYLVVLPIPTILKVVEKSSLKSFKVSSDVLLYCHYMQCKNCKISHQKFQHKNIFLSQFLLLLHVVCILFSFFHHDETFLLDVFFWKCNLKNFNECMTFFPSSVGALGIYGILDIGNSLNIWHRINFA